MDVFVAGGTGFIGRALCYELLERGHAVTAAARSPDAGKLPDAITTVAMDVTRPDLTKPVAGHDVVINLVALPSHVQPCGQTHEAVHRDGTEHLLRASEETGVRRFVQMSALGVDADVDTAYFRAKLTAERLVRESSLAWVIYRPSVVFGDGCAFLPFLRRIATSLVAALPAGGRMSIQPIWVGDVAPMLADGVEDDRHVGHVYELGGPERLTLAQTVRKVVGTRVVLSIPEIVAAPAAALAEVVPGVPMGRDQYRVMQLDNTVADNDVTAFDVAETDLRTLDAYLSA